MHKNKQKKNIKSVWQFQHKLCRERSHNVQGENQFKNINIFVFEWYFMAINVCIVLGLYPLHHKMSAIPLDFIILFIVYANMNISNKWEIPDSNPQTKTSL